MSDCSPDVADALRTLGTRKLVLAIHDVSMPQRADEDIGRGSPYSAGARALFESIRALGFTGVQLGPLGLTSRDNPSPYDSTSFARSTLALALAPLAREPGWGGLLAEDSFEAAVAGCPAAPARADHAYAFAAVERALGEMAVRLAAARAAGSGPLAALAAELDDFAAEHASWLEPDALYDAICSEYEGAYFRHWSPLDRLLCAPPPARREAARRRAAALAQAHAPLLARFRLGQFLVHRQHEQLRALLRDLGLTLAGDLPVGASPRDVWRSQHLLLADYAMGAPPSRTNPAGQPWGYPLLDPGQYHGEDGSDGPALQWFRARLDKIFAEYDAVRIDHPHGLVCPWVYRDGTPDPSGAVREGARLFESPALSDHPGLARYAIARTGQLSDGATPRHADDWVRRLDDAQVARYAILIDTVVDAARARGLSPDALVCEVLSTMPYPLQRVLERHQLGRFRVTQKARLDDPADVYRVENAAPHDWVMMSTHDTASMWELAGRWHGTDEGGAQADYLAARLCPDGGAEAMAARLRAHPGALVHAKLASALASRAENVMVFFADLFGIADRYNVPGLVSEENWALRLPPDFDERYRADIQTGEALDLRLALAWALRARGGEQARAHQALASRLEAAAWQP